MKRLFVLVLVLIIALVILSPAAAQDETLEPVPTLELTLEPTLVVTEEPTLEPTPEATPTPEPVTDPVVPPDVLTPGDSGNLILTAILTAIAAFAGSALTATIVSVLKMFTNTDASLLKNVVGAVLTVAYWLAVRYGFGDMFQSVGQFLITFVPAFIQLYGTLVGSAALHRQAVKYHFPLLNYERPDSQAYVSR